MHVSEFFSFMNMYLHYLPMYIEEFRLEEHITKIEVAEKLTVLIKGNIWILLRILIVFLTVVAIIIFLVVCILKDGNKKYIFD